MSSNLHNHLTEQSQRTDEDAAFERRIRNINNMESRLWSIAVATEAGAIGT